MSEVSGNTVCEAPACTALCIGNIGSGIVNVLCIGEIGSSIVNVDWRNEFRSAVSGTTVCEASASSALCKIGEISSGVKDSVE